MSDARSNWSVAHESFHIFECIPPWITWQSEQRTSAGLTEEIRSGVNLSIILAAACFVEGNFEQILLRNINAAGAPSDPLQGRLLEDLRQRVAKTIGSDRYNEVFALVMGKKANELVAEPELWENIKILFFFRNVIAHGRAVGYKLFFPPGVGGFWEEEFAGGYKKVEDFLLRKDLLESRHIEEGDNWHYFSDEIADFFWSASSSFVEKLRKSALPSQP